MMQALIAPETNAIVRSSLRDNTLTKVPRPVDATPQERCSLLAAS